MSYCEHCEGQRFDRARVLRALREVRRELSPADRRTCDAVLARAVKAVRELDLPHLEVVEVGSEIIH